MQSLLEFISIDNKSYDELNETQKKKLDIFVEKLKANGLEEKILSFSNRKYDVSEQPDGSEYKFIHETNFPKDLSNEIDRVWVHLDD